MNFSHKILPHLISLTCLIVLAGCQPRDENRSSHQAEKEAKVRHAVDRVAASADQVVAKGLRTAEEMKREVQKLSIHTAQQLSSVKTAGENVEQILNSGLEEMRQGVHAGRAALMNHAKTAARVVEKKAHEFAADNNESWTVQESGDGRPERF